MFKPSDQYTTLHAGAHRRAAARMGVPGLLWHLAFREPWQEGDLHKSRHVSQRKEPRERWRWDTDLFLASIYRKLVQLGHAESVNEIIDDVHQRSQLYLLRHRVDWTYFVNSLYSTDFQYSELLKTQNGDKKNQPKMKFSQTPRKERYDRYETFQIQGDLFGLRYVLKATFFHEYWTLTFHLFFDECSLPPGGCERPAAAHPFVGDAANAFNEASEALAQNARLFDRMPTPNKEHHSFRDIFVDRFRSFVIEEIYKPAYLWAFNPIATESEVKQGGTESWDCLGLRFGDFVGQVFGVTERPDINSSKLVPMKCFSRSDKSTMREKIEQIPYSSSSALTILNAAWSMISDIHSGNASQKTDIADFNLNTELTACRFQSGRAIYISSIGRLHRTRFMSDRPVIFTLIVNYQIRWQLGRLVERLLQIGTLRLAALWDFARIQSAYRDAWNILDQTRDFRRRFSLSNEMKFFTQRLDELEHTCHIGLTYRLSRAIYYIDQIEDSLRRLRIERIEGFQQYDEYLRRRLFPSFEFIRRTEALYAEVRSDFELCIEHSTSISSQRLLARAEWLIGAPVWYYVGSVLEKLNIFAFEIGDKLIYWTSYGISLVVALIFILGLKKLDD